MQAFARLVPLGLGLAEGGNYLLYAALGAAPAAGVDFTMVNRVRVILIASIGLLVLLAIGSRDGVRKWDRASRKRDAIAAPTE